MDNYLKQFREMLSLRGITDHTLTSYTTYISAFLQYLSEFKHCPPEDAAWQDYRDFILWLQKEHSLSDRTIMPASPNSASLPCMSFTNLGILTSSPSVSLIPICLSFLHGKKCSFFFLPLPT